MYIYKQSIRNLLVLVVGLMPVIALAHGGLSSLSVLPILFAVYFIVFLLFVVLPVVLVIYARKQILKGNIGIKKLVVLIFPVSLIGVSGLVVAIIPPYMLTMIVSLPLSIAFCYLGWSTYKKFVDSGVGSG